MAVRTLTAWCPDWPLAALGVPPDVAAAVLDGEQVLACSAAARADGVRRGLRRREAQRRSPGIRLLDRDELAEARAFEPVAAALEDVSPRLEVVRPGTCVLATKGPSRYFGGDDALASLVAGTVDDALATVAGAVPAAPCRVGIADGVFASRLAAREGLVVPPGGSGPFLAAYPVTTLDRPDLADLLARLGLPTLGAFAALPGSRVASRFGADGLLAHRLARGLDERPLVARVAPPDLAVETELDPPADQVEPLAFVAKTMADTLRDELAARGLVCTRILVEAETETGERRGRLWRHDGALSAGAVAQRVRWQLAGWLTSVDRPTGPITLLRIVPDEVHRDEGQQLPLWGGPTDADERVAPVLARLQGLLGFDAVRVAVPAGGRAPIDAVRLVPWGEPRGPEFDGTPPWPGRLPAPSPSLVFRDQLPVLLLDRRGGDIDVDERGALTETPAVVSVTAPPVRTAGVVGWAGPWPVDERWWDPAAARACARMQVVTDDGAARLLSRSLGRWWVEAAYD